MNSRVSSFINEDLTRIYSSVSSQLSESYGGVFYITGGAGFLGSWLCQWFMFLNENENAGIKVYILDRNFSKFEKNFSSEIENKNIVIINGDVRSLIEIPSDVNYIIHAAATPDTRFHVSCPVDTMTSIAEGTASMLNAASRLNKLKAILNVSSSAIYFNRDDSELGEECEAIPLNQNLSSVYAEAKRYAEKLCQAARNELRIPIISVRPFTFCGPYQDLSSPWILNTFINDALNNRPIRIYGDGQTVRGVMYGADFSVWVIIILLHAKSGDLYNLGSNFPVSATELATKVAANISSNPSIILNTSLAKVNDKTYLLPNISKVEKELNLRVFTNVELSVSRTVDWFCLINNRNI